VWSPAGIPFLHQPYGGRFPLTPLMFASLSCELKGRKAGG
jgi:hypothetical protein